MWIIIRNVINSKFFFFISVLLEKCDVYLFQKWLYYKIINNDLNTKLHFNNILNIWHDIHP